MTLTLPENNADLLLGRHEAASIAESCVIAFWLVGRDDVAALLHLEDVYSNFAALADKLGYDVSRKAAPADEVAS